MLTILLRARFYIGRRGILIIAVFCLLGLINPAALGAQETVKKNPKGEIELNFRNVEITNFLRAMSEALGLAISWDERKVQGSITLISPRSFKPEDALDIFETVLALHGFSIVKVPNTPLLQVIPSAEAARLPSSADLKIPDVRLPTSNQRDAFFQTMIIPLSYASAETIKAALVPLMSKTAGIATYSPANVLILADNSNNLKRIVSIVQKLDIPGKETDFEVVKLRNGDAANLAPLLNSVAQVLVSIRNRQGKPQQGLSSQVLADRPTNSLVFIGDSQILNVLQDITKELDVNKQLRTRRMRVFRLAHANAEELVKILKAVDLSKVAQDGNANAQTQPADPNAFRLVADKTTNSLIAFGPPYVLETMAEMVEALDVQQPQVYVELLIMEISLEKSLNLGVNWQAANESGDGVSSFGFPQGAPRDASSALNASSGALVGVLGNEITFGDKSFVSFSGFIQATKGDQDVNVLANPQILTLNNLPAKFNVSSVVPVSTRTVTNNQLQTTTEYEFKDVGIILNITPQIISGKKVRLAIKQESSSISTRPSTLSSERQQAITTLKRSIDTQVVVESGTTMAIGGLIQNQVVENKTKVPCLGDLWGIGWLFRSSSDLVRKTNMVVFIRPSIISSQDDIETLTNKVQNRYDATGEIFNKEEGMLEGPQDDGLTEQRLRDAFDLQKGENNSPKKDNDKGEKSRNKVEKSSIKTEDDAKPEASVKEAQPPQSADSIQQSADQ